MFKNNRLVVQTEAIIFVSNYFTSITSVVSLDWKDYGEDSMNFAHEDLKEF